MKNSLIFTVFVPTLAVTSIMYLLDNYDLVSSNSGLILLASFLFFLVYEIFIRLFTKYQKRIERRRARVLTQVTALSEVMTHEDVSTVGVIDFINLKTKIEFSLRLRPKSWIISWIILDRQVKLCQNAVSSLVKSSVNDINAACLAREVIPTMLELIPDRLASMEWISKPLIENTRAHTYMCSARDSFKKAVNLYQSDDQANLPEVRKLLEEVIYCMDRANEICPNPEQSEPVVLDYSQLVDVPEYTGRNSNSTELV